MKKSNESFVRFLVTLSQDEDGMFIAECPSIPGCVSQGDSKREALENVQDAIKECLEVRAERGSHVIMTKENHIATLSIPNHREVARGTLRSLIAKAGLTVDQFLAAMKR